MKRNLYYGEETNKTTFSQCNYLYFGLLFFSKKEEEKQVLP